MNDLRAPVAAGDDKQSNPAPVGVIRFTRDGAIDPAATIDVQLGYKNGRALGHWPAGKPRANNLLWQDLRLVTDEAAAKANLHPLPEGSWLAQLRTGTSFIATDSTTEPFLLYDLGFS